MSDTNDDPPSDDGDWFRWEDDNANIKVITLPSPALDERQTDSKTVVNKDGELNTITQFLSTTHLSTLLVCAILAGGGLYLMGSGLAPTAITIYELTIETTHVGLALLVIALLILGRAHRQTLTSAEELLNPEN